MCTFSYTVEAVNHMMQRIQQGELETQHVNPNATYARKVINDIKVHITFYNQCNIPICVGVYAEYISSRGYGEAQSRLGRLPEGAGSAKGGSG